MSGSIERVEIDEALPHVEIAPRILNEMASHAREAHPEECCGFLIGHDAQRFREVYRCRNDMSSLHRQDPEAYPRDGTQAFHMNPHDQMQALKTAEEREERVTAIYHSHVGFGVYFSELDQEYASAPYFVADFPGVDHIVISLVDGAIRAGLFRPNGAGFEGRLLRPSGS